MFGHGVTFPYRNLVRHLGDRSTDFDNWVEDIPIGSVNITIAWDRHESSPIG
jgi:hypothetical protein